MLGQQRLILCCITFLFLHKPLLWQQRLMQEKKREAFPEDAGGADAGASQEKNKKNL
jgi:hypothetical protein